MSEVIDLIRPALTKKKAASKSSKKPKSPKLAEVNQDAIAKCLRLLTDSAPTGEATKAAIKQIKADKAIKLAEVGAILSKLRGSEVAVARKADGLKEIEVWLQRRRDTERRLREAGENS